MMALRVEFLAENAAMLETLPKPVRSHKLMPDWFKHMSPSVDGAYAASTVKKCMPFVDAMTAGYLIPLWCDLVVTVGEDGSISITNPPAWPGDKVIENHSAGQIKGSPFSEWPLGHAPMKLVNPWVIKTEPDVSCLFTAPLNQPNEVIHVLSGVVDTDYYYNNVNFPFVVTAKPGEHVIRRGTPIMQVIPFIRTTPAHVYGIVDDELRSRVLHTLGQQFKDVYKGTYRHKNAGSKEE